MTPPADIIGGERSRLRRLFAIVGGVLVVSLPLALAAHVMIPEWPIPRIYSRIAGALALLAAMRHARIAGVDSIGLGGRQRGPDEFAAGFVVGLGAVMLLLLGKVLCGAATVSFNFDSARLFLDGGKFLLQALAIAVVEEIFFRGYLTGELLRSIRPRAAVIFSAGIFAVVHFLRPIPPLGSAVAEFAGLLMLGVVLAMTLAATGRIYAAIGLHAALVFVAKFDSRFIEHVAFERWWIWGTDRIIDGVVAWAALALIALAIIIRKRGIQLHYHQV